MGNLASGLAGVGITFVGAVITSFAPMLGMAVSAAGASLALGGLSGAVSGLLGLRQEGAAQNIVSNVAAVPVIYGTAKLGLKIVETRADPGSDNNEWLALVGAICLASEDGSGIEGVSNIWFDERLAIAAPAFEGETPGNGNTTGVQGEFSGKLSYGLHAGRNDQTVDARLNNVFPTEWPATSVGVGVAYLALFLLYDKDVYPSGLPNVTVEVKGVRVFDPRDSLWKWSDNPALCIRDYLKSVRYGLGVPTSELDEQSFIDAANYADELVAIPGPGTQKRFTCNGWVDTGRPVAQNVQELLTSCRGELVYEGGKFRLLIRKPTAPTAFELDESNIVGDWSFRRAGTRETANAVRTVFVNPEKNHQPDEVMWPEPGAANAFLTNDNSFRNLKEVDLPFTGDYYMAQQIGMVLLRESREDIAVAVTAKEAALQLRVGDVVPLSHPTPGFTDKDFWVTGIGILPDGLVRLGLSEYDAGAYSLDAQNAKDTTSGTNLPDPFTVQAPTDLTLLSDATTALATQDGAKVPRILATWTRSVHTFLDHYELEFKPQADAQWTPAPNPARDAVRAYIWPVTNGVIYDVRIRAVNTIGNRSTVVPDSVTVSTSPSTPSPLQAPTIDRVEQSVGSSIILTHIEARLSDALGRGGTLKAWVNKLGTASPDPTLAADGEAAIATTPAAVGPSTSFGAAGQLLSDIKANVQTKKRVYLEFITSDGVSSGMLTIELMSFVEAVLPTGRIIRAVPHDDGDWAPHATTIDGHTLHGSTKESAGKAVNRLLAKALAGNPDDADGLEVGLTWSPTKLTALTSGEVDFAKAGVLNKFSNSLLRSAANPVTVSGIIQNVTDAGHAGSAMQESGGKVINRLLAKALAGNPDDLDGVPEGTSFKRVTATDMEGSSVRQARRIRTDDTRATNELPSFYRALGRGVYNEFKQVSTMGVGSGTYGQLATYVPWNDSSGGVIKQEFITEGGQKHRRFATSEAAWGAWRRSFESQTQRINIDTGHLVGDINVEAGDLYIPAANAPVVGASGSPSSITKELAFYGGDVLPALSTQSWQGDYTIEPITLDVNERFYAMIHLPPGTTLTGVEFRASRASTNDTATGAVREGTDIGGSSLLASLAHDTTGWQTKTAVLSEVISIASVYFVEVTLKSSSPTGRARFLWLKVNYTMPSYDKSI